MIMDQIDEQIVELMKRGHKPSTIFMAEHVHKELLAEMRKCSDLLVWASKVETLYGCKVKPMPDIAVTAD